jgi:hypothetical protein
MLILLLAALSPLVLAAGCLCALFSSTRRFGLRVLRFGFIGAVGGAVLNLLLNTIFSGGPKSATPEGLLIALGAGFGLLGIGVAVYAFLRYRKGARSAAA